MGTGFGNQESEVAGVQEFSEGEHVSMENVNFNGSVNRKPVLPFCDS
jgi:hypothetical protein